MTIGTAKLNTTAPEPSVASD